MQEKMGVHDWTRTNIYAKQSKGKELVSIDNYGGRKVWISEKCTSTQNMNVTIQLNFRLYKGTLWKRFLKKQVRDVILTFELTVLDGRQRWIFAI